jgi:hypothetical protein
VKYKIIRDQECHCCGVDGIPIAKFTYHQFHPQRGEDYYLCEICASTHFSKAINWPQQISDPTLYQSIAGGFSILLKEIRKGNAAKKSKGST